MQRVIQSLGSYNSQWGSFRQGFTLPRGSDRGLFNEEDQELARSKILEEFVREFISRNNNSNNNNNMSTSKCIPDFTLLYARTQNNCSLYFTSSRCSEKDVRDYVERTVAAINDWLANEPDPILQVSRVGRIGVNYLLNTGITHFPVQTFKHI